MINKYVLITASEASHNILSQFKFTISSAITHSQLMHVNELSPSKNLHQDILFQLNYLALPGTQFIFRFHWTVTNSLFGRVSKC